VPVKRKEVAVLDALVLSDLHLGSKSCQVLAIQEFLEELPLSRRLVLIGDVLESTDSRLTKQHWRVLSRLRKLSDSLELIWVRGNHDCDAEPVAHLIGADFMPEYVFESGKRRVLCLHGDAWDRFLTDHPIITLVADWFYLRMQRINKQLAVSVKRNSKTFLRCVERVRKEATAYGKAKRADVVICGHTHSAEAAPTFMHSSPAYFNSGCWTDQWCHYLTVQNGFVQLHRIPGLPICRKSLGDTGFEPATSTV
jgi:UDP-2,3-diacylglucosamine pyrophosphatase LpxH